MVTSLATYWDHSTTLEWLQSHPEWAGTLVQNTAGGALTLPALRPLWEEVRDLSPGDAARYLQSRVDQGNATVEVLGLELQTRLIRWLGPLVVLGFVLYLYQYARHLVRARPEHVGQVESYPWVALFEGRVAWFSAVTTIGVLPVLALLMLALRVQALSWPLISWVGLSLGLTSVASIATLRSVSSIRSVLADRTNQE